MGSILPHQNVKFVSFKPISVTTLGICSLLLTAAYSRKLTHDEGSEADELCAQLLEYDIDNGYFDGSVEKAEAATEEAQAVQLQLDNLQATLPAGLAAVLPVVPDDIRRGARNEETSWKYTAEDIARQHRSGFCGSTIRSRCLLLYYSTSCSHQP